MKKAAATVSFVIAALLLVVVIGSFVSSVHGSYEALSPEARDQAVKDAENGVETVGGDNGLSDTALLVMGLAGGGFLVAGFALWPKATGKEQN
jgi:hypothetical protein